MIAVVIPAKNEEKTVGKIAKEAKKYVDVVIVVDDGSEDETSKKAFEAGAKVLKLSRNMGKGYAMRIGAKRALEIGADKIIFMDADGQHRPSDIPKFVEALEKADAVFGQRKAGNMPLIRKIGNFGVALLFRILFGKEPGDMLCGFKAFRKEALEKVWWKSNDYFVETEITAKAISKKLKIKRIDIPAVYLNPKKGIKVSDGIKIVIGMILMKIKREA